jgi:hypothetical protein
MREIGSIFIPGSEITSKRNGNTLGGIMSHRKLVCALLILVAGCATRTVTPPADGIDAETLAKYRQQFRASNLPYRLPRGCDAAQSEWTEADAAMARLDTPGDDTQFLRTRLGIGYRW